ncbi:hypothetical protein A5790_14570 [Mycobacterium sp. 852002-51152_SCH6134967]|uniref:hypothetical protein n=1 Tax=Mycobacterium sp. 852002-51152_SCH6134967 TaxID=1834096 RepID=UPI00080241CC|nr:hypothetical protein [Mycobacterium sp. 852002-51152_SCH6134967]OBF92363.1 hypothetical protein A5790_14570 [Mycobacterium sp. 852002-51152_SCH6134967]
MTKLLLVLLCGVGIAISAPAPALADEGMYLTEVRKNVKASLTDGQAFQLGQVACEAIRDGLNAGLSFGSARANADRAVGRAQNEMGLSLSMPDGMFLVEAAEHQLC